MTTSPESGPPATVTFPPKAAAPAHHSGSVGVIVAIALIVLLTAYIAVRSGRLNGLRLGLRVRPRPVMLVPVGLLAVVVLALVINQTGSSPTSAVGSTLATNPNLDPGTELPPKPAPAFKLTDESGRQVSLAQYRGKVVILSFVDAECQTIWLTTQAMLDAKAALGKAGKQVQLLGVNANWHSTQVDDVLKYTEQHGLMARWHFLTTSGVVAARGRLDRVSRQREGVETAGSNDIEHIAATYVIDPQGRMRYLFTTYPSYAAIGQMGQLLGA